MTFDPFIGSSYVSPSVAWDAQRAFNLFIEADESGAGKSPNALLGTPGLTLYDTLPTSPVRAIWTGLADLLPGSTATDLAFVVAGSKLYEVYESGTVTTAGTAVTWLSGSHFSTTAVGGFIVAGASILIGGVTYTVSTVTNSTSLTLTSSAGNQTAVAFQAHLQIGDVGDDSTHSPVTMEVNGTQIFITSAGLGWIYDGSTLTRAFFNNGLGTVDTSGTAVTWVSGDGFDASLVGSGMIIAGTGYVIAAYVDATHVTLSSSAGTQTGAAYTIMAGAGTLNVVGSSCAWVSGQRFNGLQTGDAIIIGGAAYVISTVTLSASAGGIDLLTLTSSAGFAFGTDFQIAARVAAAMGAFLDGYGLFLAPNSKTFGITDINNFKRANPLDFGRKSAFPDNIASILTDHEEAWLFGSETTEVWRNTGAADFPLQRDPGAFIHQGIRAPFSAVSLANGVAWIGGDARGNPVAWRATGYQPVRVSTHGVETAWAAYATVADAVAFVYTMRGHQFWVINFPGANATWVYDATAAQWHERGWWNGSSNDRVRYQTHGYVWGKHIVGDWSNGKLYELSESVYTDAGTAIHRYRTAPHLTNEELWTFYNQFRLACQAGLTPTLSWSDDSGTTWHAEVTASARYIGGVSQNSVWRRLGKARDRIWRVTITDAAKVALFAAYLDLEAGS